MQLSINIPQDEIDQISSRIAKKVTEEVMRQLKENLQKLGVKVEPEGKVGDVTHWVPIQYLQTKQKSLQMPKRLQNNLLLKLLGT